MKGFKLFFLLLFLHAAALYAQPELSLVTVYPGNAIYSAFGHIAFRYVDKDNDIDILYNYGTFDFRDPEFVPKFVHGKLDYFLSVAKFKREFKNYTLLENRSVAEQKLNLTPEEIAKVYTFLAENAMPENRYYKYDFIKDNCATRIQLVFDKTLNSDILFDQAEIAKIGEKSYRSYIRHHLKKNPWFDVGIQLALGMPLDQQVLPSDSFFLPALVHNIIAGSTLSDGRPLVAGTSELYRSTVDPINDPIKISPPLILALLLLAIELSLIYLGCIKKKCWARKTLNCYEFTLVILNFLFGLLIFYLWFISDHTATKWNLNLLWCCPLAILFRLKWISAFMAAMGIVFLLVLMVGLQSTSWAFIPLIFLFIIIFGRRAIAASFNRKTATSV